MEPIEKICPLRENENENDWGRRYLRHQRVGLKQLVAQSYLYDHSQSLLNINGVEVPILTINPQSNLRLKPVFAIYFMTRVPTTMSTTESANSSEDLWLFGYG